MTMDTGYPKDISGKKLQSKKNTESNGIHTFEA